MTMWSRVRLWMRAVVRRSGMEQEMDAELRFHIEAFAEDLVRPGVGQEEARRRARIEFGGIERVKEEGRKARGSGWFDARLILLNETTPKVGLVSVSYPNFLDWRTENSKFSQMAAVHGASFNLAGVSQPETINGQAVSPNFLSLLGVRPFLGRDFDPSEEKAGAAPVVMLSYSLWQSHLGGDRSALGRTIVLDGRGYTIISVCTRAGTRSVIFSILQSEALPIGGHPTA